MYYDWTLEKNGKIIGRLSEPQFEEMFWHTALFTPNKELKAHLSDFFKGEFWKDCQLVAIYSFSKKEIKHIIIRTSEQPNRLSIRGIPAD